MGEIDNSFMKYRRMRMYKRVLIFMMGFGIVIAFAGFYIYEWNRMPEVIYVESGKEQVIDFDIPASGEIYLESVETGNYLEPAVESISRLEDTGVGGDFIPSVEVDFSKEIVLSGVENQTYCADLKLFGVLPYKTVRIETMDSTKVIPSGQTVGIYVKTDGVYVIDIGDFTTTDGETVMPCKGILQSGDYIVAVNGEEVTRKKDFTEIVHNSGGATMIFTIKRGQEKMDVKVTPALSRDGSYKIGAWIRDSLQGVGTMTFIEEDGDFGALGHAVRDIDTNELVTISSGALYETSIVSISRGEEGEPGSVTGLIQYEKDKKVAEIEDNTTCGIHGTIVKEEWLEDTIEQPMEIALKQEIKKGDAYIISAVSGTCEKYSVEIVDINYNATEKKRALTIQVTDERLLDMTGGIVQGMSGSPIIQDGKIIGAVTHVLVNHPEKGYGIFLESMLNNGN